MNQAFDFLTTNDAVFSKIVEMYGFPAIPFRSPGFSTLVLLILEQQVSIDSAKATFLKLVTKVVEVTPEHLSALGDDDFRSTGVSRQKTSYIKGLANAILNKEIDLESLSLKNSDDVRAELIKLKGIGNWTIDIYLMFAMKATDIFPIGDIAVINTVKELYGIQNKDEILEYSKIWAPYRSYATYLLWHHYLKKRKRSVTY